MINFKIYFKQLARVILSGALVITVWLGIVPSAQAAAVGNPVVPTTENSKRIQAIASCLPAKLTIQEQDAGNRIANALSEMKNDQLERILDITDNPKLSQSEIEFKNCLQQKGFTPQAELQDRSYY
ncbi:MAG: hypothetical protein WBF90_20855 [Rivularia sp. (in: cyanobacteria)]|jgi:hypothetical protein